MDFFDEFEQEVTGYEQQFQVEPEPWWAERNEENERRAREYNEKFYEKSPESLGPEPMQEGDDSDDGVRGSGSQWRPEQLAFLGGLSEDQRVSIEELQWQGLDMAMFPETRERLVQNFNQSQDKFEIFKSRYGYGLRTLKDLERNEHIGDYTGALIRREEGERLPAIYDKLVPAPDPNYSIVGDVLPWSQQLNYSAFANDPGFHTQSAGPSKKDRGWTQNLPNAHVATITDRATGESKTVMYATRKIPAGSEVLYYYGYPYWSEHPLGTYFPDATAKVHAYNEHIKLLNQQKAPPEDYPEPPPEAREMGMATKKRRKGAAPRRLNV